MTRPFGKNGINKTANKQRLADLVKQECGVTFDVDALFDVQADTRIQTPVTQRAACHSSI